MTAGSKGQSAKLTEVEASRHRAVNRVLAEARSLKPSEIVIWYSQPGGQTGVLISEGTQRVKTVGALNVMAYDVWGS